MSATSHNGVTSTSDLRHWVERTYWAMAHGARSDFEQIVHPRAVNREAATEPPAARQPGPAGFHATARWLRDMFADLAFDVHDIVAERDLVAMHVTMSGRHVNDAVFYHADATVDQVFPATGRAFAATQSHWYRVRDGMVIEHWANRDDQGMAVQLGWVPPTPLYLLRMQLATRRARRRASN
jgi:predicted ester cyclase